MSLISEKLDEAFNLFDQGKLQEAEELYEVCIQQLGPTISDDYVQALHGLGYVKASLAKYDEARNLYKKLMKIAQSNNEAMDHCMAVHQLGMVERMAANYEEGHNLFRLEAELLHNFNLESPLTLATNFYEQGYLAFLKKELVIAKVIMEKSLQNAIDSEEHICIGCAYRGLGEIYRASGEELRAKEYFEQAKEAFELANDMMAIKELQQLLINE